jgi:hypothetical protein
VLLRVLFLCIASLFVHILPKLLSGPGILFPLLVIGSAHGLGPFVMLVHALVFIVAVYSGTCSALSAGEVHVVELRAAESHLLIVHLALCRVRQQLVGLGDLLELLSSVRPLVKVRVVLLGQLEIRRLDILLSCVGLQTQHLVVVAPSRV